MGGHKRKEILIRESGDNRVKDEKRKRVKEFKYRLEWTNRIDCSTNVFSGSKFNNKSSSLLLIPVVCSTGNKDILPPLLDCLLCHQTTYVKKKLQSTISEYKVERLIVPVNHIFGNT